LGSTFLFFTINFIIFYLHGNIMKKIFILAGEASGDLHGSNLVKAMRKLDASLIIEGWGGKKMEAEQVAVLKDYRELAFMGFSEVLKNIGTIIKNFKLCKAQILHFEPDAIIFIDYPGFNLRMAKWAKKAGFKTIYYISPQIWAWKENRVKQIRKYVDKMIVILPFEQAFYKKWDYDVHYVGHPLVSVIEEYRLKNPPVPDNEKYIAMLPGSRKQEIREKLPLMLEMVKTFTNYQFVLAKAPGIEDSFYTGFLKGYPSVQVRSEGTYHILHNAYAALVTSGTATLETALFQVPQVVCYKGNKLSYLLAKQLIKVKYISLVNLILDKMAVTELIQDAFNQKQLQIALTNILDKNKRAQLSADYESLIRLLSKEGDASIHAATLILKAIV
jgi:lipid-A-disaccharide synthase